VLLAVDSATENLGLAVTDGATILAESVWASPRHASVELAPEVARLLRRIGISEADLTGLAVAIGPGSYTGLRIGLALVKGMAMGLGLKVVGVPTLDILARGQPSRPEPMLALARAGRARWLAGWYHGSRRGWKAEGEPAVFDEGSIKGMIERPTYLCGEFSREERSAFGQVRLARLAESWQCVRRPGVLAQIGWERLRRASDPIRMVPVYAAPIEAPGS
jgi:tRNA threonylcarbamoyladenosine biosynthesis protein TsaB